MSIAIHWFRRDLRLNDNTALLAATAAHEQVIPVYIISDWRESHRWTGPPRQEFLCGSLAELAQAIERKGGRLIFRRGAADTELAKLAVETGAEALYFNRDPDPFGRAMEARLKLPGVSIHSYHDVALHDGDAVLTAAGTPFRVFTPYGKAWSKLPKRAPHGEVVRFATPPGIKSLPAPTLETWGLISTAKIIAPGEQAARQRLERFLDGPIFDYADRRNFPAAGGTSRLSQDLRYGTLSIREIYGRCQEARDGASGDAGKGVTTYLNELAWREFYMAVLWHWPEVLEHEFNEGYRGLQWTPGGETFTRWCEGTTGFPIVDAGMREMAATGFMHNRLRMITAMFLTKDLHLDWREGERLFMQMLTDGEISANNGGWQWSASTGTDAAPYFRIQNPWLQSRRFDPDGEYIKRWIPELREVPARDFSEPPPPGKSLARGYPRPMVNHHAERDEALRRYRVVAP